VPVVTFTFTVHEPSAGIFPPAREIEALPAFAVTVPPHVVVASPETTRPAGRLSVRPVVKVATVGFALVSVITRDDIPPTVMDAGLKDLFTAGGTSTAAAHEEIEMAFVSMVTAPFCARARPERVASVVMVILVRARIFPTKEMLPRMNRGTLTLDLEKGAPGEDMIRELIGRASCEIKTWTVQYATPSNLSLIRCDLQWKAIARRSAEPPPGLSRLRDVPGVAAFYWEQ
jgi:hypothetical protein